MITVIAALMFGFIVGYPIGYEQETGPVGIHNIGVMIPEEAWFCLTGEAYYSEVDVKTNFSARTQTIGVSWQCPENNGARIELPLYTVPLR